VWGNDIDGEGYDTVLLGQAEPLKVDLDAFEERWNAPENVGIANSIGVVGFRSSLDLLTTYAGRASDLAPWLLHAQINDDMSMRLQYLAGMGLNFDRPAVIYNDILEYRRFPEDMFTGSAARVAALRIALASHAR
jgi:hypothetical protein